MESTNGSSRGVSKECLYRFLKSRIKILKKQHGHVNMRTIAIINQKGEAMKNDYNS